MASFRLLILFLATLLSNFSSYNIIRIPSPRSKGIELEMQNKGFAARQSFQYSGKLRPGTLSPKREVPVNINRPDYALTGKPKQKDLSLPWEIAPKSPEIIEKMRVAGRIAREVLDEAVRIVKPGITTDYIDSIVHQATISRNAYPSPLNYHNFPKSCCTSINEVICHGIPDSTILQDGDIINIDVTVYHDGVHGDCSETILVGNVNEQIRDLVMTTYTAWQAAINYCKPGMPFSGIGGVIEDIIAPKGYTTVKEFCGHGNSQRAGIMAPGQTFTIEPMICLGSNKPITWQDKWTATTADGSPSAQFEHTLLITNTGVEALTAKLSTSPKYSWE